MAVGDTPASAESTTEPEVQAETPLTTVNSNEPTNPALEEPDAMAIVQKSTAMTSSVSQERKQQLLRQARAERRKWVHQVPLPYASARDPNDVWAAQDRMHPFQSSLVCQRVPVLTKVLSELYGLENHRLRTPDDVAERVDRLVSLGGPRRSSSTVPSSEHWGFRHVMMDAH